MTQPSTKQVATLFDALVSGLRSCDSAADGVERPAAILWTDPDGQWASLVQSLQERMPELLILGEYKPDLRQGPAIWLRCVVDGALEEPIELGERIPILYLPKIGRQMLRAGEDCPSDLRPLVELLFRGVSWKHPNGQDWSLNAFMGKGGLGLNVARDEETRIAMIRALSQLAQTPLGALRGRHLEAEDFDRLLTSDVVRDLLLWVGDPVGIQAGMDTESWEAFCNQVRLRFNFDPTCDGELTAGEHMVLGDGPWAEVWGRFAEVPSLYPGVVVLLDRVQPPDLFSGREKLPAENARAEEDLRAEMQKLVSKSPAEICQQVLVLEAAHGCRRRWLWADLGKSSLAIALQPLACLAEQGRKPMGGSRLEDFAEVYVKEAWLADASAWEAVAAVSSVVDQKLIGGIVQAILLPWMEKSARAFQEVVHRTGMQSAENQGGMKVDEGTCLLFADGLRFDLAQRLVSRLEERGCTTQLDWRWAGIPTVTATGKPLVSPAADDLHGQELGEGFAPHFKTSSKPYYAKTLRQSIERHGYQIVAEGDIGLPLGDHPRSWTETADIDTKGHEEQERLPERIPAELARLAERIQVLLDTGWEKVRVVTDHGWLWTPEGLPKVDLPKHLTESRWARCASLQGDPKIDAPIFPWSWNQGLMFASAPGVACFNQSPAYAHGGVSIQECLIPVLDVTNQEERAELAAIRGVIWRGMRCLVEADGKSGEVVVDLRLGSASGPSVVASSKPLDDGAASLVVSDDEWEESDLILVLLGDGDKVLAQKRTKVGENS
jgi:hypothetical protein